MALPWWNSKRSWLFQKAYATILLSWLWTDIFCENRLILYTNLELKLAILVELYEHQSRKLITNKYFVSDGTITHTFREAIRYYQPCMNYLPPVLCMDKFKSMKLVSGSISFICIDETASRLFTILEDHRLYKSI